MTAGRLWLLREVAAGRVRWLTEQSEAWLIGDELQDVTGLWMELVRSQWVRIVPWNMADPTPASAETELRAAGEEVLMQARRRAPKKTTRTARSDAKTAPAPKPRPAVTRRTYRPAWLEQVRRLRPRAVRRRTRAAVRGWWNTRTSVPRAAAKRWRPAAVQRRVRNWVQGWLKPQVRGHYRRRRGE